MTPALGTAQNGLTAAGKRFGAAATSIVAISAAPPASAETQIGLAVQAATGTQDGAGGQNGRLPLPEGLLALLQEAGVPQAKGRVGAAPSLERAVADSLLAQRAFEANLRSFQAADAQLGETLDLIA